VVGQGKGKRNSASQRSPLSIDACKPTLESRDWGSKTRRKTGGQNLLKFRVWNSSLSDMMTAGSVLRTESSARLQSACPQRRWN
jgi:hypothetical protein